MTNAEATVRGAILQVIVETAHVTGLSPGEHPDYTIPLIDALILRIRNGPDHWAFVALAAPGAAVEEIRNKRPEQAAAILDSLDAQDELKHRMRAELSERVRPSGPVIELDNQGPFPIK